MKQLTDNDLEQMFGGEFAPDDRAVKNAVRKELKLSSRIPEPDMPAPDRVTLDLHQHTEEQAWERLNAVINSGARYANVITGASGILKIKFQDWVKNSTIAPRIYSCTPINNGSFEIQIRKRK